MRFASMGSGSAGNCLVVQHLQTRVLLDCGFGARDMLARLGRADLNPAQISGILVTHEHDDHARGAFKFAAQHNIPVYLTYGTFKMCERYLANGEMDIRLIDSHTPFKINDLEITPYPVPHDAREPTQFTFHDGNAKLSVLTDAGSSTPYIEQMLSGSDALVLECNHDLNMLQMGPYAASLKKRVGGKLGHLDNQTAADLLTKLDNSKLKHIIAAHLSVKNNTPVLAKMALSKALSCSDDWIGIADQANGFDWREI